jgi:hypothetical protein
MEKISRTGNEMQCTVKLSGNDLVLTSDGWLFILLKVIVHESEN